uniref:Glucose-inhibited division protein A n=1 Tax=Fulvimarina pelagi TaxID=217511 RepID=A0A0P0ZA05_9HYPH|nr:glucose-inhibited division protein A [Fulvimarina pelagi]
MAANLETPDYARFAFDSFLRLEAALFAGAAGAVAGTLLLEARGVSAPARYGVQMVCALVFGLAVWFGLDWGVYPPALVIGLTLAIPLAPYLARGDGLSFWSFTVLAFVGVVLAFAAVLIFVTGVIAIIEMIAFLFDIDAGSSVQEHIFITAITLVGPLFALGRIPTRFDERIEIGEKEQFVRGIALLAGWVSAPLALVAALVLYLYAAKILVTGIVPNGEIGWIVSFFSLLTVLLRIAAEPIRDLGGVALRVFAKIWPWLLILPLGLLGYAVWTRIAAEGFTIARYYLALEGFAAAILAGLAIALRNRLDIRWLAGIPVVLILLSSFGPQGVASTVGRSQSDLIFATMGSEPPSEDASTLSDGARQVVRSRIYALAEVDQLDRLSGLTQGGFEFSGEKSYEQARLVIATLGLEASEVGQPVRTARFERFGVIDIAGFDRFAPALTARRSDEGEARAIRNAAPEDGLGANVDLPIAWFEGKTLLLTIGDVTDSFVIDADEIEPTLEVPRSSSATGAPSISLASENGRTITLVVLAFESSETGEISFLEADLLYREEDWAR